MILVGYLNTETGTFHRDPSCRRLGLHKGRLNATTTRVLESDSRVERRCFYCFSGAGYTRRPRSLDEYRYQIP